MENTRNFCIIAHIDHGKSTIADRLLQKTKTISERDFQEQNLDDMELERERGITIKSHAIQMNYQHEGTEYHLNLIDTPGHVDFSYEVSRSIAACEGCLLVVDASQGVQAQTISNLFLAMDHDLEIIPVINKIDLDSAKTEEMKDQIIELIGCERESIIEASGKTGIGIDAILSALIERIPPPQGDHNQPLQALIFDSIFNTYRGVIAYFRIFNGTLQKGDEIQFMATGNQSAAEEIGILRYQPEIKNKLNAGDVGYLISGIKDSSEIKVGDTVTHTEKPCQKPIEGFKDITPMVFAGIYPVDTDEYENLRSSIERLQLNDASLSYEPEFSKALGFGFRCGFLGLLHMEIIQERLDREFGINVIITVPNVSYRVYTTDNEQFFVSNPSELPEWHTIQKIEEPFISAQIITKTEFIGPIMNLCIDRRGELKQQTYLPNDRVEINFEMPLSEIVYDFYDKLKSMSKGYASLDYHQSGYREANLVKLDILINREPVDALSTLINRDNAYEFGRKICDKLKELIPRQQFEIPIQASIGSKVIARETVKAMRKDVTAKCYGGDVSRKRKLLEKQKKGKKRMRQVGKVEVPQEAFMAVFKMEE